MSLFINKQKLRNRPHLGIVLNLQLRFYPILTPKLYIPYINSKLGTLLVTSVKPTGRGQIKRMLPQSKCIVSE